MKYFISLFFLVYVFVNMLHSQVPGGSLFDETKINTIYITFSQPSFWDSLLINHETDTYMKADISINGIALTDIGIRLKGNSSFDIPSDKKSVKIDFNYYNDTQEFDGLKKINLNNCFADPSFLREKIFYDYCNDASIPSPRANFAKLYLNNEYWGLYTLVDQVDPTFLDRVFGNKNGNLFCGDKHTANLIYEGDSMADYSHQYSLHTNTIENNWSDLINLIDIINHAPDDTYTTDVYSIMDEQSFYNYWASEILFIDLDSYIGRGDDYWLYDNPEKNKFEWIFWDCNESFGKETTYIPWDEIAYTDIFYLPEAPDKRPPIERALNNEESRNNYLTTLNYLRYIYCNEEYLFTKIDTYSDLIRDAVYTDTSKMYTNENFEDDLDHDITVSGLPGGTHIPGLKQFITNRCTSVQNQLDDIGFVPVEAKPEPNLLFTIYPTLIAHGESITISGSNTLFALDNLQLCLYDITGKLLSTYAIDNAQKLSLPNMLKGIYIYSILTNRQPYQYGKLVIQ